MKEGTWQHCGHRVSVICLEELRKPAGPGPPFLVGVAEGLTTFGWRVEEETTCVHSSKQAADGETLAREQEANGETLAREQEAVTTGS